MGSEPKIVQFCARRLPFRSAAPRSVRDDRDRNEIEWRVRTARCRRCFDSRMRIYTPSFFRDPSQIRKSVGPGCRQCQTGHCSITLVAGTAVPSSSLQVGTQCPVPGQCHLMAGTAVPSAGQCLKKRYKNRPKRIILSKKRVKMVTI